MKTAYFWLTPQGEQLALRLQKAFGGTVEPKAAFDAAVQRDFVSCDLLVFIMASGIAVRKIAPLVQSKAFDPAVLVLDQQGKYVISLLSGHLGGANAAARRFAAYLGGEAVITTATDVAGVPAFDLFAKQNDLVIENLHELKHISSALVAEEKITLLTDMPVETGEQIISKENAEKADLIIYVVDASRPLDENDHEIIEMIRDKKAVILLNKSDLSTVVDKKALETLIAKPMIDISAKEETGIHELESTLKEMFYHGDISFNDEVYITNIRHKTALADALSSLKKVEESIENQMPEDFFTIDLMDAYESLGSITGETIGEDLVNEIFSKFCMGK